MSGELRLTGANGYLRGAGVDLVDLPRLHRAMTRSGPAFAERLLGAGERHALPNGPGSTAADDVGELAARLAVKESVVKLLGGLPPGGQYADIVVDPAAPAGDTEGAALRHVRLAGVLARREDGTRGDLLAGVARLDQQTVIGWAFDVASATGTVTQKTESAEVSS